MELNTEIKQLTARNKEVVVGLADGTILRGKFGGVMGEEADLATFDVAQVVGPAQAFMRGGVLVALRNICWIDVP